MSRCFSRISRGPEPGSRSSRCSLNRSWIRQGFIRQAVARAEQTGMKFALRAANGSHPIGLQLPSGTRQPISPVCGDVLTNHPYWRDDFQTEAASARDAGARDKRPWFRDYRLPDVIVVPKRGQAPEARAWEIRSFHKLLIAYRRRSSQQNLPAGEKSFFRRAGTALCVAFLFQIVYMLCNCRLGIMKASAALHNSYIVHGLKAVLNPKIHIINFLSCSSSCSFSMGEQLRSLSVNIFI